ncbi:MAG: type III pantothenate kinase [Gammaproteobacteria bacterium]|nr:type III pantothenate kinase [Gammaproteobacteria bacterium]
MLLCLDVGNTCVSIGVFENEKCIARFECPTHSMTAIDFFSAFLSDSLKMNRISPDEISAAVMCSVVPTCDEIIQASIENILQITCLSIRSDMDFGFANHYKDPKQLGVDRVVNIIAVMDFFPREHCIIVDMGTATTVCALHAEKGFLGGAILPGLRLAMSSLKNHTAQLMEVAIEQPNHSIAQTTQEGIQSGLFYGQLGAIKEILAGFKQEAFANLSVKIIGTGGYAQIYQEHKIFDAILPDLTLQGLRLAHDVFISPGIAHTMLLPMHHM